MQRVILLVSPDTEFLQQLRSHLEEGGRYQVSVALSAHEALNLANSNFFEVAIVDGELDDIPVAAFTRDLTALQSDLKILVFPPDNNPQHPVLDGLSVNGYLSKPFSGQEIGKALSSLFSDQPLPNNVQVKVIDDLVKQWLQIPETGGRKAEQILKATTSQTVLIIIKDQLIASAGSLDNGLVQNVTGFLSRYWKDEENSELARYIKLDGDGSNRFLYTTKLVNNVVLVMVYPMNATLQMVRRELNKVKNNFQQNYPTTGELRQDIAKHTLVEINTRNKQLESLQISANTFSQSDIDVLDQMEASTQNTLSVEGTQAEIEARKLFEQESLKSKPKPEINTISQEEIDLLKALQDSPQLPAGDAVSQAELEARKLFEQESVKPKPTIAAISQEEIDLLKALQDSPQPTAVDAVAQAELEARKLFEQESVKPKPTITAISQEEIDLLKTMQNEPAPAVDAVSQAELEARKLFEQESIKPKPTIAAISQEEIDLLKALQNEPKPPTVDAVSQAELEARKLFEQESIKPKPTIAAISQEEIDLLKAMQNEPAPPSVDAVSQAEIEARKLFEQESIKPKPAINGISQEEIDLLKAMQETNSRPQTNDLSETEIAARKLFEQESLNKATIAANDVSQIDLDALGLTEQESLKAEAENPSNISEQELAELTKMLDQMPDPDPQPGAEIAVEEKKLPEWLTELETADNATMAQPSDNTQPRPAEDSVPAGIPPFLVIDESLKSAIEKGEPLPEIDFKLPWEDEENTVKVATENLSTQTVEPKSDEILENVNNQPVQVAEPVLQTEIEALKPAAATFAEVLETVSPQVEKSTETMPAMVESAALTVSESMATQETETSSTPPSLKDFRFNYTLVLMPGDHNHFLTKNLSDKLSTIMPDIHEDQGWKMTSITIRPQYLLWTVAVRFGVCPNQIMQEVRNLTSNSIFANFPEIAKVKTSNDFWSSNYLAVSGSEPAQANLIFDFVNDAWKTPEAAAL